MSAPPDRPERPALRFGQVVRLRPEHADTYRALHRDAWPGVLAKISECNITNYSIFERDGMLFAYFEYTGADLDSDLAKMASHPETQRWWTLTDPCQERIPGHDGPTPWADMTEVFHHD